MNWLRVANATRNFKRFHASVIDTTAMYAARSVYSGNKNCDAENTSKTK